MPFEHIQVQADKETIPSGSKESGAACIFTEPPLQALRKVVDGIGPAFSKLVSAELLGLLYKAARHPNRFIRETSYHTLASICSVSKGSALKGFGRELATCLQDGLSENWSQVDFLFLFVVVLWLE